MCTRRLWFGTFLLACSEIPVEAASEMMATNLLPSINHLASRILMLSISDANLSLLLLLADASKCRPSSETGGTANLGSYVSPDSSPIECRTILARLPVISATFSTPPSLSIKSSRKLGGKSSSSTRFKSASLTLYASSCVRGPVIVPSALCFQPSGRSATGKSFTASCSSAVPFDLPLTSVLKCSIMNCLKISCVVEVGTSLSNPYCKFKRVSCASPVVWRPIKAHSPLSKASSTSLTTNGILKLTHNNLKNL
mmetsp:Transcript_6160/g.19343  ORF Transcript_6160/g.19343 Transcript_6160/m.19343 type:complete len:254 (+) Transcript_6160:2889-3650(+)